MHVARMAIVPRNSCPLPATPHLLNKISAGQDGHDTRPQPRALSTVSLRCHAMSSEDAANRRLPLKLFELQQRTNNVASAPPIRVVATLPARHSEPACACCTLQVVSQRVHAARCKYLQGGQGEEQGTSGRLTLSGP